MATPTSQVPVRSNPARPASSDRRAAAIRPVARRRLAMLRYARDVDWPLWIAAVSLSVLGTLLVWSASLADEAPESNPTAFAKRHALSAVMGVTLGFLVTRVPYQQLRTYAMPVYLATTGLLLIPLSPLGQEIAGARAWITLPGGFSLQPSELAKVGLILGLAATLAAPGRRERTPSDPLMWRALLVIGAPMALVLLQNDTGTMLVMAAIAASMIILSGASLRWILGLATVGAVVAAAVIGLGLLADYQVDRLTSFIDPEARTQGAGFNTQQARIAIGGGGLFGQGLFAGAQTQGSFVPVNESDFIFTVAAEELGLVGAVVVILLIAVLVWRGFVIALRATDAFGRLVALGIVAWFAFQSFENIGMALGIMPVTGVTLPLVSYGGSSVMAVWIAIGVLQAIHLRTVRKGRDLDRTTHTRAAVRLDGPKTG